MISTSRFEKRYIRELARSIRARRIVEVGAFKGETTALLSAVAAENGGYVVAVDPMRWASAPASLGEHLDAWLHPFSYERAFWKNVRRSGADNVRLYRVTSDDPALLRSTAEELQEFDLAFIDADHSYAGASRDLALWGGRVVTGGLILMHDVRARFPGVRRLFRERAQSAAYRALWPVAGSVGVLQVLPRAPLMRASA
jgi:predicted O-methyltransferase YrrM